MAVNLNTSRITDWDTFHTVFAEVFGFPNFYGRNMNAWIDCMGSLGNPEDGMTTVHAAPGGVVTLHLEDIDAFVRRCPEIYDAIVESAAFVNWRRMEIGQTPVLAFVFSEIPPR